MTETFSDWTSYDAWLVKNYEQYAVYKLDEKDGKVVAEYRDKSTTATPEKKIRNIRKFVIILLRDKK